MYLNNTGMSGLGYLDPVTAAKKECKQYAADQFSACRANSQAGEGWQRCQDDYSDSLRRCAAIGSRGFSAGGSNAVLDNISKNALDLSRLTMPNATVDTLKPAVSPAVVNPSFAVVPAYSSPSMNISDFRTSLNYGTPTNRVSLGNVDTGVDTTPEFWKGNNKYYTIAVGAAVLGGIYYATTKKGSRRRR